MAPTSTIGYIISKIIPTSGFIFTASYIFILDKYVLLKKNQKLLVPIYFFVK